MQVYVGQFSEAEVANGLDKVCVAAMQEKTGLKYVNTSLVKKRGEIVAIKIYVCDIQDLDIRPEGGW